MVSKIVFWLMVISLAVVVSIKFNVFSFSKEVGNKSTISKENNASKWIKAQASFYDPLDHRQTKTNPDGIGTSKRRVRSGSIALGSTFASSYVKRGVVVYIEIKGLCNDIVTPYGKNIFRVDDLMAKRYRVKENQCYVDFYHKDLNDHYKSLGRFGLMFRVIKIIKQQVV